MPSRRAVALIVLFWLGTAGFVVRRDVWPRLFAGGPPPIAIDLADEASQSVEVRWTILRNDQKVGRLTTWMRYVEADDSFKFTHTYRQVQLDVSRAQVTIPELTAYTRVTRGGQLREQGFDGKMLVAVAVGGFKALELEARGSVKGVVRNGVLTGTCEMHSPLGDVSAPLEPVAVPAGQVLNPLQPVNRLANVRPGLRWVVPEVNPLRDSIAAMLRHHGVQLPEERGGELIAEVLREPEAVDRRGKPVPCWVIEYRGQDVRARTWVRAEDGKVLRQEAYDKGERLTLDRDE